MIFSTQQRSNTAKVLTGIVHIVFALMVVTPLLDPKPGVLWVIGMGLALTLALYCAIMLLEP